MNIYQEIKTHITARDVATAYGLPVGRNGLVLCPFHDDHHPSMLVKERFHCFGCGASGDAVDLAARLFRLPSHDAAVKIITDFSLPVSLPNSGPFFSKEERCAREAEFRRQREMSGWEPVSSFRFEKYGIQRALRRIAGFSGSEPADALKSTDGFSPVPEDEELPFH